MIKNNWQYYLYVWALIFIACTKPYEPPEIKAANNFLVVDGIINSGNTAVTTIVLSRSRKLTDTVLNQPETAAQLQIEEEGAGMYLLQEKDKGIYTSAPLSLNDTKKYRLKITTVDGKQYASAFLPVNKTPPIDSVSWKQDNDVMIYVSTHDPQNSTRYYRWDFTETWEYQSTYESDLEYKNGQIIFRHPSQYQKVCWSNANSTNIMIGSSANLTDDVIYEAPVHLIPQRSIKIGWKYSILVRQYALTPQAYNYWQILQKNTEQQGSIFDAQPSQLTGNIQCITNPEEPVIGFISASTVAQKRIFIQRNEVTDWLVINPGIVCEPQFIFPSQASDYLSDGIFAPAYFMTGGGLAIARKECIDCTLKGGTNVKPLFWQ